MLHRLSAVLGLLTLVTVELVFAEAPTAPSDEINPPRNVRGEPEVGSVRAASSMLGQQVRTDDDRPAGKVVEVALDLEEGRVATLVIAADDAGTFDARTAIPWELVQLQPHGETVRLKLSHSALENAPQLQAGQGLAQATRLWLATVYQHFEVEPYWHQRQQASAWGKAGEYGKYFNKDKMVTVEGQVNDISYFPPLPGMAVGAQLTIRTADDVVKVQLGPLFHLSEKKARFEKGADITVRGSQILLAGEPVVMATVVTTAERKLRLRDADGAVRWREWTEQDAAYAPASLKNLLNTPIRNNEQQGLGKVSDLAITKRGLIAYVGMTCTCFEGSQDKLFPVPLSAFVVRPDTKAWLLELPLEVLENTTPFSADQWPEKIDRGWVEYVHVRYGRSPFGGVRTKPQTK